MDAVLAITAVVKQEKSYNYFVLH